MPIGLSLKLELSNRFGFNRKTLDVKQQLKLAAQPICEIVAMPPNETRIRVHRDCDLDSGLVEAQLRKGTRLRVLETRKIPELGLKRAHIVLLTESEPLGWMTISCTKGECATVRPVYARPLYVVESSPLVRKQFERTSRAICMLPVGTKLTVVDTRRDADGGQRVRIVLLGQDEPFGWITAKRQQTGWTSIREVAEDDPLLFSPGASPPSSRPPSARGRFKSPRDFGRWFAASAREQGHANFALAIAQARAKRQWTSPTASPQTTPRSHRSPVASPRASPRPSIFNREQILKERFAATAPIESNEEEGENEKGKQREGDSGASSARKGSGQDGSAGGASERRSSSAGASSARRVKRATDETNAPILPSSTLEAAIKECQEKAANEEAKLDPSKKTLPVLLGESLLASKLKVSEVVQSWNKKGGNEPLSKMEFRQNIRKLLDKADSKKIDAMFDSLDENRSGTLDLQDIRTALKKLQDAAGVMARSTLDVREKIERIRQLESLAQQALEATRVMEEKTAEMERLLSNTSVSARLGAQIILKRMKVGDVLQKWDANGDGELEKPEFRQNVKSLGVQAEGREIDELFDSLNTDGGKTLSMAEVKVALKTLTEDAAAVDKSVKDIKKTLSELAKAARAAQVAYRRQHKDDEAIAMAEAEQAAREAEVKAAAAAEAKAVRDAALEIKKRAAAAAKAEFEAKVAAKRSLSA